LNLGGIMAIASALAPSANAQSEYRNLEAGRPVRVSDATPTARGALDIDLTTLRLERVDLGGYRIQYEPRIAYGLFPRTEISLRVPAFRREAAVSPRSGVAGVGVGAEYQLIMEGPTLPAIAFAGEAFIPTGPNAIQTAVSLKGLLTRSFPFGRFHLNGTIGTFAVRKPAAGPVTAPVVIDGPCSFQVPYDGPPLRAFCMAGAETATASSAASTGVLTKTRWTAGAALDKALARRSILLVADVFTEKLEGIGRAPDWTAEGGVRKQVNQVLVVDAGFGRRFSGISTAWFATFGTTLTLSVGL
jgi:hypothetical protein